MHKKTQYIDFTKWTESQKVRYYNAKTELEKEQIVADVQAKIENEEYQNQILRQNALHTQKQSEAWEQISNESSDSIKSDQEEIKHDQMPQQEIQHKQEEQYEGHFQLILNLVLKRTQVDYLLMKRYSEQVIEGAFVRIHEPQFKRYVLAQVIAVVEGDKSYQLEQSQTYKLLKLQYAEIKDPKIRYITQVSNQKVENQELIVWKKKCEEFGIQIPSRDFLTNKYKEIQFAIQNRLTDDQVTKRIVQNLEKWTAHRSNVLYHDLPIYLSFLTNQINKCEAQIDKWEEAISEIQESNDNEPLNQYDQSKVMQHKRQIKEKQQDIQLLQFQLSKVQSLIKSHQEKEQSKLKPVAQNQLQFKDIIKEEQTNKTFYNSQYSKQKDLEYIRHFEGIDTIQGSENFKEQFIKIHQRDLPIDNLIDDIMLVE